MNLKNRDIKKYIPKIIWGIIILLLAIFFLRVFFWEESYYAKKEGSTRAAVHSDPAVETIDETEPTEEEVTNWASHLPDHYPAYISIVALGQHGRQVTPIGTNDTGELSTPNNIYQLGWYEKSSHPGGGGVIVMDGHNGGPNVQGVLKQLPLLCSEGEVGTRTVPDDESQSTSECTGEGDIIYVERADGEPFAYKVVENITVPLSEADAYMATAFSSPVHGKESITLITCTGEWSAVRETYLSRQFTRAILIEY